MHLLTRVAILCGTNGSRILLGENTLLKQQLMVLRRARTASPKAASDGPSAPRSLDFDPQSASAPPRRHSPKAFNSAAVPSGLKDLKCRLLYSSHPKRKPGPKGPAPQLIHANCERKRAQWSGARTGAKRLVLWPPQRTALWLCFPIV